MISSDPRATAGSSIEGATARLERLRGRLAEIDPSRPGSLKDVRDELETLQAEDEGEENPALAAALKRLALLTELWECLAAESPRSAGTIASFCVRALEFLAAGTGTGRGADRLETSWILEESSTRWSEYLGLIEPGLGSASDRCCERPPGFDTDPDTDLDAVAEPRVEDAPPEIDPVALFQMLTGGKPRSGSFPITPPVARSPREEPAHGAPRRASHRAEARPTAPSPSLPPVTAALPTPSPPAPPAPAAAVERPRPMPAPGVGPIAIPQIDEECREAFLAEALDLFERIQSLVLDLARPNGQEGALHELGRCLHTLKGAAGSVGLIDLASRVHHLEQKLEDAAGVSTPGLRDQLHEALAHLEAVLDLLKQGEAPAPGPALEHRAVELPAAALVASDRPPATAEPRTSFVPAVEPEKPAPAETPSAVPAESSDGPIRIPSIKMDELMDLASELIMRRGVWAAQANRLKEFAAMIRGCRNELRARLDRLNELGLGRKTPAVSDKGEAGGALTPPGGGIATDVLRLAEQVEDLAVLTETAQAQALPLADESDALTRLTLQLWETLQSIRIVPIRGLFQRLARVAHDAARIEGREVEVVMIGEETGLDRAVQDKAFEPLLHVVRNAVGHGIEAPAVRMRAGKAAAGRITLEARREGNTLVIAVQDDGQGLDYAAIAEKGRRLGLLAPGAAAGPEQLGALIFRSGFSTRDEANAISGRGVGMDVVAQEVRRLRGTIDLSSQPGAGTRLLIRLPARLALEQAMIARVAGQAFAIPVSLIEHAQTFEHEDVEGTGRQATVRVRDRRVPLIVARQALGFSPAATASCPKLLLVRAEGEALALLFDAIEGTRELVIKPLGPLLAGHPVIWGTSLSLTGDVIFILNPSGLFRRHCAGQAAAAPEGEPATRLAPVLVVDDSISVRRVVTRQLRMLGLEVEEVSNGVEALGKLASRSYSMVLTDLEMPRMDGFELLAELRRSPALAALPVIVASTESRPATRRRALALGARAFVAKPIDQDELAQVAGALLNRPSGAAPV